MTAFQYTNEQGGSYLRSTPAERDRRLPPGTVMHGFDELAAARAAAASAARGGGGGGGSRGGGYRQRIQS